VTKAGAVTIRQDGERLALRAYHRDVRTRVILGAAYALTAVGALVTAAALSILFQGVDCGPPGCGSSLLMLLLPLAGIGLFIAGIVFWWIAARDLSKSGHR